MRAPDAGSGRGSVTAWVRGGVVAGAIAGAVLAGAALGPQAHGGATPTRASAGPRRQVYPDTLPVGPGFEIAGRACLMCHASTLIAQQHKDSTAWEKTLGLMTTWGAPLTPGERDTLRSYLLEHFGPRR